MEACLVSKSSMHALGLLSIRKGAFLVSIGACSHGRDRSTRRGPTPPAAAVNGEQDHYAVLGVSSRASSADIKRAYRCLARTYHPDVCKDLKATEVFKSIRLAYEVLSNAITRARYDQSLQFQEEKYNHYWRRNRSKNLDFEDDIRIYRWDELRQRINSQMPKQQYNASDENFSAYDEEDVYDENSASSRGSFLEVLKSAFLTLFLTQTLGVRLSLTICGLTALLDKQLDAGYKLGFFIAWLLGGRGGVLLSLSLSFASWLCGKTSSSIVALVVVAMFIGTNFARFAPFPPGAVLTLLYMSIKLQVDLS